MVAEALAMVAIGWFVPSIFAKVLELAASFARGKYKLYTGLQNRFDLLAKLLQSTKNGIELAAAASSSNINYNEVVWRFKDAIGDAEELLDALLNDAADAKVKGTNNTLFGNSEYLAKLDRLIEDLSEISDSLQRHLPQPQPGGGGGSSTSATAHQLADRKFYGYSDQYSALRSSLLLQGQRHQVVAVIGHGGTGKTALACRAFKDKDVRANFDLTIWVCVSAKFTETDLLREICKCAARSARRADVVVKKRDDATSLHQKLEDIILHHKEKKTRYLLVLDDVCNDESAASEKSKSDAWSNALDPFKQHGARSSRILITTRAEICATRLGAAEPPIVLRGLHDQDMKHLIAKTAFGRQGPPAWWWDDRALADNIAKLSGSPLLAEAFGNRLKGNVSTSTTGKTKGDDREMQQIMREEIPRVVCETHLSSYQNLPPHLQRCLAFCSLFPTTWVFGPEKLVKMWVALGFIIEDHRSDDDKDGGKIEETAMGYFVALRKRCLFQKAPAKDSESGYMIDKHIHSMLRTKVCRNYFLSIHDSGGGGDGKSCDLLMARHLAVTTTTKGSVEKLLKKIVTASKLRTLIVFQQNKASAAAAAAAAILDKKMLKELEGVRVMDLSDTSIREVPGSIGMLKQVRYLGLPSTVGKMSSQVTTLSLVRYLDMPMEHIAGIAGIGSLQMLQGSLEFHADRTKVGHSIRELEKLDSLSGTLSIKGLEAVKTKEEAQSAHLERKRHVEVLKLEWGHHRAELQQAKGRSSSPDSIVLTGLRPHDNLQELYITRYQGKATPFWMADAGDLQKLRSLNLRYCTKLLELPPVGDLPLLQVLEVKGMSSLEWIDGAFCGSGPFMSLERLMLSEMPKLLGWEWESVAGAADHQLAMGRRTARTTPPPTPIRFPKLSKVEIVDCPKLSSLSGLLTCRASLSFLRVKRCWEVTATIESSTYPSLRMGNTDIQDCQGLTVQLQE